MLRRREGERLPAWLAKAEASGIDDLARFAGKLRTDLAAVQAGLTLRYSNGQTEGQVTKLKLRQAPGLRAGEGRPAPQAGAAGGLTDDRSRSVHRRASPRIIRFAGEPPFDGEVCRPRPSPSWRCSSC